MTKENEEIQVWCNSVAEIAVDAMLGCELVKKDNFKLAVDIVAEEIFVRLIVGDYPPPCNRKLLVENTQQNIIGEKQE
jgi:hypothetical protein